MKSQYLENFTEENKPVDSLFAVKKKNNVHPYKDGKVHMFSVVISDKTDEMLLNYFGEENEEEVKSLYNKFENQDVIHLVGTTNKYLGRINIIVTPDAGLIEKTNDYDLADFLPMTKKDISQMVSEFKVIISQIEDPDIKRLLEKIFDVEFLGKYSKAAAASSLHHNFGGGLIEHVLNMIKIAVSVVERHPELDKELLIAGCILHDIGKVNELKATTTIEYTIEGHLLGHITIGQKMINDWIDKLENFPVILKQKILHMVLSHHGKKEWGSPVEPLLPEAIVLHHIDNLDSKIQHALQQKEKASTSDKWIYDYKGWPILFLD